MLLKGNYFKATIITGLIIAIVFTNVSLLTKITAESGVGNDVFKVIVSLFGITNSTKDVITLVNVKDQTKVKVFNAEDPGGEDKVSYTMTFPGLNVDDDEPYNVCAISTKDFKIDCEQGKNSPLNRPEFVDIDVSGQGGQSSSEDEEEQ